MQLVRSPVSILLDGLHDPGNIGSILRLTNAFAIEGTYYRGKQSLIRIHQAAVGTQHFEKLEQVNEDRLDEFLSSYDKIVAFDNRTGFQSFALEDTVFHLGTKYLFIFGNETNGISIDLLRRSSRIVTITQRGLVGSLNVAIAAGIAVYEYNKQIFRA